MTCIGTVNLHLNTVLSSDLLKLKTRNQLFIGIRWASKVGETHDWLCEASATVTQEVYGLKEAVLQAEEGSSVILA